MDNAKLTKEKINWFSEIYELLISVAGSLVFVVLMFTLVFRIFIVTGPSMQPTLQNKDRIIVSNLFYTPAPGDIICFKPDTKNEVLVKRIIAIAGQTVTINEQYRVCVDGKVIDEPYLSDIDTIPGNFTLPYTVEPGKLFVLGDNRGDSSDSRSVLVGPVDINHVLGRIIFRAFPKPGPVK